MKISCQFALYPLKQENVGEVLGEAAPNERDEELAYISDALGLSDEAALYLLRTSTGRRSA
ncbi:MAG: hypothetical protein M1358_21845, partial [Chloroflexi bacterium]|nr:hypothetical protein [Chloroflexota bacterium]